MSNKRILYGFLFFVIAIAGVLVLHYNMQVSEGVFPYCARYDKDFIIKTISDNWYWVVQDPKPILDPQYIERRFIKAGPKGARLSIKVYRIGNKPVGFVTYYEESFYCCVINIIAVGNDFRGKGYGRRLLLAALEDLKQRGCVLARLLTRTNNTQAIALYQKNGFKEYWRAGEFVRFEKNL
jgi:ribosomal protein S18 acetylase RimI-like enzyme